MDHPKFSVLMSLYIKEKAEYFDACMKSILKQTAMPNEIVIVLDGPISNQLRNLVDLYKKKYSGLIKIIENKQNKGLGLALSDGVPECAYELIARMDTDDIARNDRFEKQLEMFEHNPQLDICGSHIIEFEDRIDNVLSKRKVPIDHKGIVRYQRTRSAFNHMTVMYKKMAVLSAGNYEDCPLMEDDMLWVRMIMNGAKCANVDDYLVYARTGREMIKRRGGWSYFVKYYKGRKRILQTGFISYIDFVKTILIQFIVVMLPIKVRLYIFRRFLR